MPCPLSTCTIAAGLSPRARRKNNARCNSRTSASVYIRYLLFVRCGATSPTISHARNAEDEIPTRRATSLMRSRRLCEALSCNRVRDWLDEFFPLDTGDGFL
jgi:hypothetical protein